MENWPGFKFDSQILKMILHFLFLLLIFACH